MSGDLSEAARFSRDGFLLVTGLFDIEKFINPLCTAYKDLFDAMTFVLLHEVAKPSAVDLEKLDSVEESFATVLGLGGSTALNHIDPASCFANDDFGFRSDFPNAHLTELFRVNFDPKLLDLVELILGPEFQALLCSNFSFRLDSARQSRVQGLLEEAKSPHNRIPDKTYKRLIGTAAWRIPAFEDLGSSLSVDSKVLHAVVFLNECKPESGGLKVLKGSHKVAIRRLPMHDELKDTAQIEAEPGDVLLLDHRSFVGSNINSSGMKCSWHISLRFLPSGEPRPQPFAPCFVARSRSGPQTEIRNPALWAATIRQTQAHISKHEFIPSIEWAASKANIFREAREICDHWRPYQSNPMHWLSLARYPHRRGALGRLKKLIGMGSKRSPFLTP